eukprot:scaffold1225_cov164-Amphora_coffeaeformis.AAC.23
MNASIEVELSSAEEATLLLLPRLQASTIEEPETFFSVTATHVSISSGSHHSECAAASQQPAYAAIFLPATVTESILNSEKNDFIHTNDAKKRTQLSKRLLALVHPFLAENFSIKGILKVRHAHHAPADIVLVDLSHTPMSLLEELLQTTNGQVIHAGQPELVLQVLMIYAVQFVVADSKQPTAVQRRTQLEIPSCPVCLHRIDPIRLGLPKCTTVQLCSKFCTPPNLFVASTSTSSSTSSAHAANSRITCPQQRLLLPWPSPSFCSVCRTVDQYWQAQVEGTEIAKLGIVCGVCRMQQTLWVCMTCGFLGCGRYSNKHAADHFVDSGHPFSLELATLRIWDYVTGGFVQRTDLLECPSAWPLLQPWLAPSRPPPERPTTVVSPEKAPKKATMIGEEYEALLQSALEEQAQHYEGELTRLRAQLTAEHVDRSVMTPAETAEVEVLQAEISTLRLNLDHVSRELLDAQALEAAQRATSANLLRQQQVAQDLVQQLEKETADERALGRQQVDELEQQIADLTANQRMRHQFTENEELQQAQIWGMTASNNSNNNNGAGKGKNGKKQRRGRK